MMNGYGKKIYTDDADDDPWLIDPTHDMSGLGIPLDESNKIDVNMIQIGKDLGPDILQKVNKTAEEMGSQIIEEHPLDKAKYYGGKL